jgi:gamma-glutamylcyclotransferase (GGCT)/AIG2-like uncharacterized protein YtfP
VTDRLFGYGALLDTYYGEGHPARLDGYELGFNGFATVRFRGQHSAAYGVLLDVDERGLARFDRMEGFFGHDDPRNYYDRVRVSVYDIRTGEQVRAWVYVMREDIDDVTGGWKPDHGYVQLMRSGYVTYGLPMEALDDALRRDAPELVA